MAAEVAKVSELAERRRVARLLEAVESHEHATRVPARRLQLAVDGEHLADLGPREDSRQLVLPPRARSLTVRDERGAVRAFVLLDELSDAPAAEPCVCDDGRLTLSATRDGEGSVSVKVTRAAAGPTRRRPKASGAVLTDEPLDEPPAAEPLAPAWDEEAEAAVDQNAGAVQAVPAPMVVPELAALHTRSPWARALAAAAVAALLTGSTVGYMWYRNYQDSQGRLAAEAAEKLRLEQEREELQRAKEESDRRIATLLDQLKASNSEAERARIQAELAAERAKAATEGSGAASPAADER
jgi:hypothetical protein